MGKVSLHRLTVCNFRSFEGSHTIEFDDTGLYLIRGTNKDSRGESGSGKSTLFLAIAYALDYAPYAATELRTWLNEEPMYVELELKTEDGPVTIHRGDKLWMMIQELENGKPKNKKVTSAKGVAEKLDTICGMNKKMREAITYRKQRTFGLFLSKTDTQKKEFLVELLGLHWVEKAIEDAVKLVSDAIKEKGAQFPIVEAYSSIVDRLKSQIPEEVIHTWEKEELTIDDLTKQIKSLAEERQKLIVGLKYPLFSYDYSVIESQAKLLEQCRVRLQRNGQPEIQIQSAQREIFRLQSETSKLFDSKCPRCDRQWNEAIEQLENNSLEIKIQETRLKDAEEKLSRVNLLKTAEKNLNADLESKKKAALDAERAYNNEVTILSTSKREQIQSIDDISYGIATSISSYRNIISERQKEMEGNKRLRKYACDSLAKSESDLIQAGIKYGHLAKIHQQETDYLHMLRGFLGQIFAEVLQEISEETNRILANLPNASKVSMRFDTNRETNEGKTRNEITPVANFGGREWPLESGASGGMFTSIELAVDLAVGNVIARRTGVELAWLILDESFANGSDKVTKEGCLEILKQYSDNKLIMVVEHASEFKEFFSKVIEIEFENERSRIK